MIKEVCFTRTMERVFWCEYEETYHIIHNTYAIAIDDRNNPVVIGYHDCPDLWTHENVQTLKIEADKRDDYDLVTFLDAAEEQREWIMNRVEDERMEARLALLGARFRKMHGL